MATYAIVGSTGNCGSALVTNLLRFQDNKIHAYCRNKAKLHRLLPETIENKQVTIFEGNMFDIDLMANCIRGTKAIFLVLTTNDNIPGCRLSQDSAGVLVKALEKVKVDLPIGQKLPKLVLLSSATVDDHLSRELPWFVRKMLLAASSNVYEDLRRTETFLRSHESWLTTIYIKPAGLALDESRGHKVTLDEEESFLSYLDLSNGMIEAADAPDGQYDGLNVGVVNAQRGHGARFPRGTPITLLLGLTRHFFPFLHPYLPSTGPA